MGRMVHLGKSGQGEDSEEASRCRHTQDLGTNNTGEENPALCVDDILQVMGENPQGDVFTREKVSCWQQRRVSGRSTYSK